MEIYVKKYVKSAKAKGGGLLEIQCGEGKTVMALKIISELKKKTLVIVHKEFLLQQWKERINQFLPTAQVGRIQGDIIDIDGTICSQNNFKNGIRDYTQAKTFNERIKKINNLFKQGNKIQYWTERG